MAINKNAGTKFRQLQKTHRVMIVRRKGIIFEIRDIDDTIIIEKKKG